MTFDCPLPATLTAPPAANACPFKIDQIVRLALQRIRPGQPDAFTTTASVKSKAAWVAAMAATGDSKVVVTPIFSAMVIAESAELTEGGNDNSTPFGVPDYLGEGTVTVPFQFRNIAPAVVKALRKYTQESIPVVGAYSLGVYLFTKNGQILCVKMTTDGSNGAIPIFNWRIGTRGTEGFNKNDKVPGNFVLPPYWDENVDLVTPTDFNPLFDL